jgi:microsomal dipeptidase-like Zn-dependent dipeptidase
MPNPNFDFHIHPSFKTFLGALKEPDRKDCWKNVAFGANACIGILNSQSSLTQMKQGNVRLAVANVLSLERPLAKNFLLSVFNTLSPQLDDEIFRKVRNQNSNPEDSFSYFDLMMAELIHLVNAQHTDPNLKVKIIKSMAEFVNDDQTINLILAAEGGHNFYGEVDKGEQEDNQNAILRHLGIFKRKNEQFRMFYITLVHLYTSHLGNHAFAIKLITGREFKPAGKGLTDLGKIFIREALRTSATENRILIDIKHMSLQSRLDFYKIRKEEFPDVPIIASHIGVTGTSFRRNAIRFVDATMSVTLNEVYFNFDLCKGLANTYFNPWSINMYLEDIEEIVASGGLMGVSLDKRILGCEAVVANEFLSAEETILLRNKQRVTDIDVLEDLQAIQAIDFSMAGRSANELHYLANNILYIVRVGQEVMINKDGIETKVGDNIWKHICIGSDFDGLIEPINGFEDSSKTATLRGTLKTALIELASLSIIPINVPANVEDLIMFDNAFAFMNKHYR